MVNTLLSQQVAHPTLSLSTTLMTLIMVFLPVAMLFGPVGDACLSHAYFAPGWFGFAMLLIPADVTKEPRFAELSLCAAPRNTLHKPEVQKVLREVSNCENWLALDTAWVDETHTSMDGSGWDNYYNTGLLSFWQTIVDDVVKAPCVLLQLGHWTWYEGDYDDCQIVQPS